MVNNFIQDIMDMDDVLSYEEIESAVETLKMAKLDAVEKEKRLRSESDAKRLLSHDEETSCIELPLNLSDAFISDDYNSDFVSNSHCDSIPDGLMMSLDMLGMVDIEFIASATGSDMETVISTLKGSIYQNPLHWNETFYKGWETADEYLSGNIMHKYQLAKEANEKYNGRFQSNIDALEKILDPDIATEEIYVTLGSPWVPTDTIDEFIQYMAFGENTTSNESRDYFYYCGDASYAVRHDEYTGYWDIPYKTRFKMEQFYGRFNEVCKNIYGTERMDMLHILENTLNMRTLSITDPLDPFDPECKARVINQAETIKVLEKQRYMIETFQNWVWKDESRKARLQSAYNRKYGHLKKRIFDGSFLEFHGMNKDIELYDYQKNAVARILFSPNTLLAHDVGSGKTYVMIAAGMELRRLGKSKKNLYVVPNNIIGQWENTFREMYPNADILVVTNKNFDAKHRAKTLKAIKREDHDAILMTYSCFDTLPLSKKHYSAVYNERLQLLEKASKLLYSNAKIEQKRRSIKNALSKLRKASAPSITPFDELGINTLFVDEAHNYKNVDLENHIAGVRGLASKGSAKANGMMDKVHCVQRMNNGGRVVFATGTPVTNSLSDIFVMQKYLQEGELEFLGINTFDAWAGMFAEQTSEFEIDLDTNSYHRVTRFSKFCNVPELTATLSSIADFHKVDTSNGIPELDGYSNALSDSSQDFKNFLHHISNRVEDIRQKKVSPKEDNMLKVTSDGRRAALDMRLIDEAFGFNPDSKVMCCVEKVLEVYDNTRDVKGTQLIFCDISTPKAGFNIYDELKEQLISKGIPSKEIAFIHDAKTESDKNILSKKVNNGEIAILIGSTAKMGLGMNVQKHLIAVHHLDVPWRPSDMVQREGRILRQGNENEKVQVFRYITRGSFDAYSWQLLETKQRFIGQIMSGNVTMREGRDVDDAVLNYAEVKALAVGNPMIKRRVELCNELDKYIILQKSFLKDRQKKEQLLITLPERIEAQKKLIASCQKDIDEYEKEKIDYNAMDYNEQKFIRERIYRAVQFNQNIPKDTEILTFQGFKVIVPAYMVPRTPLKKVFAEEKVDEDINSRKPIPYVHLVKNGTYRLEIESESWLNEMIVKNCLPEDDLQGLIMELKDHCKILFALAQAFESTSNPTDAEISALSEDLRSAFEIYVRPFSSFIDEDLNEKIMFDEKFSDEERETYNSYRDSIISESANRLNSDDSKNSYYVIVHSMRLCKLLSLKAPTVICANETHSLAEAMVAYKYGVEMPRHED